MAAMVSCAVSRQIVGMHMDLNSSKHFVVANSQRVSELRTAIAHSLQYRLIVLLPGLLLAPPCPLLINGKVSDLQSRGRNHISGRNGKAVAPPCRISGLFLILEGNAANNAADIAYSNYTGNAYELLGESGEVVDQPGARVGRDRERADVSEVDAEVAYGNVSCDVGVEPE